MKKRFLALLLSMLMLVSLVPMQAMADELLTEGSITLDGITYTLNDGTLTISGEGELKGGYGSYFDINSITSIVIEHGITDIPAYCFNGCTTVTSVTLPESLTSIGQYAFCGCGITSIDLPASLTIIDMAAFSSCENLENITIARSYALETIGYEAFSNTAYFNNADNWENNILYIDGYLIAAKSDISGDCIVKGDTMLIATAAFYNCASLKSVKFPALMWNIGLGAFCGCTSLDSVTIPSTVKSIDYYAFDGCTALADVFYGGTSAQWKNIDIHGYNDPLLNATLHTTSPVDDVTATVNGVTYYDKNGVMNVSGNGACTYAWRGKNIPIDGIVKLIINQGITGIEYELNSLALYGGTFENCTAIESVTLPTTLKSIGRYAFYGCSALTDVYYAGSEEDWAAIEIGDNNDPLLNANIHYNAVHEHNYSTVVVAPTCTEIGYTRQTCECGSSITDNITAPLGHAYGTDNKCADCGFVFPFADVKASAGHAPFAASILWASESGITAGYPDGTFRPDQGCTRAQVVTFLWRAAGSPEPETSENPFSDVSSEGAMTPYYSAILWAAENGITSGYPDGTFRPNAVCTRAQVVTFLWRAVESPEPETTENPFSDVSSEGAMAPYYNAILWAVENGITTGYPDGSFRPNATCTRAHVVTFIYRLLA